MAPVKPPRGADRLVGRAEHHCKDKAEGAVKPADRVVEAARVLGDRRRHPGMRQLEQQGAPGSKKNRGLAVDPPDHRAGPKNAAGPAGRRGAHDRQLALEIGCGHAHGGCENDWFSLLVIARLGPALFGSASSDSSATFR